MDGLRDSLFLTRLAFSSPENKTKQKKHRRRKGGGPKKEEKSQKNMETRGIEPPTSCSCDLELAIVLDC